MSVWLASQLKWLMAWMTEGDARNGVTTSLSSPHDRQSLDRGKRTCQARLATVDYRQDHRPPGEQQVGQTAIVVWIVTIFTIIVVAAPLRAEATPEASACGYLAGLIDKAPPVHLSRRETEQSHMVCNMRRHRH